MQKRLLADISLADKEIAEARHRAKTEQAALRASASGYSKKLGVIAELDDFSNISGILPEERPESRSGFSMPLKK